MNLLNVIWWSSDVRVGCVCGKGGGSEWTQDEVEERGREGRKKEGGKGGRCTYHIAVE